MAVVVIPSRGLRLLEYTIFFRLLQTPKSSGLRGIGKTALVAIVFAPRNPVDTSLLARSTGIARHFRVF